MLLCRLVFTLSPADLDLRRIVLGGNQDWYLRVSWHAKDRAITKAAKDVLKSNGTHTDSRLVELTDLHGFSLRKHACLSCKLDISILISIYRIKESIP